MRMNRTAITQKPALIAALTRRITYFLPLAAALGLLAWQTGTAYAQTGQTPPPQPSAYSQSVSEHYSYRFGEDKPIPRAFLPQSTAAIAIRKLTRSGVKPPMPTPSALPGTSRTSTRSEKKRASSLPVTAKAATTPPLWSQAR